MKIDHYKNVWLHLFKNTIEIFLINIHFIFNFNDFGQIKNFKKSHIFLYFKPRPVTPSLPYSAVGSVKRSLLLTEKVRTATPEQSYSAFSWRLMTIIPIKMAPEWCHVSTSIVLRAWHEEVLSFKQTLCLYFWRSIQFKNCTFVWHAF